MTQRYYSMQLPGMAEERAPFGAGERQKGKVPRAAGLSTAHISPLGGSVEHEKACLSIWPGASLVKVSHEKWIIPQVGGGPRGQVSLFSRQSKKRLMNLLGTIERNEKPLFCTLTYPATFPISSGVWKTHLDKFWKRMIRKFPGASTIWKLEPQKRGAPHYHLLVWGVERLAMKKFISAAWYESVGSGDLKHLHAGTQVEDVQTWRGVMSYASKYMGKIFDMPMMADLGWDNPGRFWGIRGRENLPEVESLDYSGLKEREVWALFRLMRKHAGFKGRSYKSLTVLTENPTIWLRAWKTLKE